jgi:adenylosuccinate synthase
MYMDGHTAIITELEAKEESENSLLSNEVGSTKQGVGAAESKRILRSLKLAKDYPELSDYIINVPQKIIECVDSGGRVQVEGSQGHFLSLYHGAYPYVTSRNTTSSGILSDVGVGPRYVENVILIFKAFITRVGGGPLDGEIDHREAERLGMAEYGTVTGRPRRAAPFDADLARDSIKISSANQAAITKLDVMFKGAEKVRDYDKLPIEARDWIREMENRMGVPVTLIGTGEDALDMVDRREELLS